MREPTQRHLEIIACFEKTLNFTEAGKELGITRQRVEQVVKQWSPETLAKHHHYKGQGKDSCESCNRSFEKIKRYGNKNLCTTCHTAAKEGRKPIFMTKAKQCGSCKIVFDEKNRVAGMGLCRKCYSKLRHSRPEIKAKHKLSTQKYFQKNKDIIYEKNKSYLKEYYAKKRALKQAKMYEGLNITRIQK